MFLKFLSYEEIKEKDAMIRHTAPVAKHSCRFQSRRSHPAQPWRVSVQKRIWWFDKEDVTNERYVPRPYSARARCSLVVFRVHWDRQCTIPLSRLASKSESRSGNISRLCSRSWNLVERTTRTCFQWQSAWINEIFSERNFKMRFAGFAKSPQIGGVVTFLDAYPQLVSPVMSRFSPLRINLQAVSFGMT